MHVRDRFATLAADGMSDTAAALLVVAESIREINHEHQEIAVATLARLDAIHSAIGDVVVIVQELKAALP